MIVIRMLLVVRIVLLVRVLLHDPLETTPFEPLLEALDTPREEAREAPEQVDTERDETQSYKYERGHVRLERRSERPHSVRTFPALQAAAARMVGVRRAPIGNASGAAVLRCLCDS